MSHGSGAGFDPEQFAEEKYERYFAELQAAYKRAFETMNDRYDSTLVHAIDQTVLAESEPFYEPAADDETGRESGRTFRIGLPEDPPPAERIRDAGVVVDDERLETVLDSYRTELRTELEREFLR